MRSPSPARIAGKLVLGLSLLVAGGLASAGRAQITYGTLDNFDVINDTGGSCHGFEIELEGITPSDVVYTFGGTYQRYGDPAVIPTANGVIIRYSASYAAGQWSASTPFTPPPYLPTQGHSCWTGGVADPAEYYASGCDHFGASLNAVPTATHYRWLVEGAPGTLVAYGGQMILPAPAWNVAPAVPGGQPVVQAVVVPPPPDAFEFGEALWAKVFVTELPEGLHPDDLDHMVIDDPVIDMVPDEPIEVEIEWVLLQASIANDGEQAFGGAAEVGAGNDAVSRRFEYYKYAGAYDLETHEALCDNPLAPDQQIPERCGEPNADGLAGVGDLIGAHNAAINLAGPLNPVNGAPIPVDDVASTDEDVPVLVDVVSNDSDPDGDSLTLVSVQDAVNGTVAMAGQAPVFTPLPDFNGAAGFSYTVDDAHGGMSSAFVDVTVAPVNDPPVAVGDDAGTDEDTAAVIAGATLLGNDMDVDFDSLKVASVEGAVNGTVALTGSDVVFTPAPNFFGTAGFDYTADDGHGAVSTAHVHVTVAPVNDAPVAVAGPAQTVRKRTTVRLDGTRSWDVEADPLTYAWTLLSVPRHSRSALSDPASPAPTFVADKPGTYVVRLTVRDGALPSTAATVTITATVK